MQPELSAMLVLVVTISMMATPPLFSLQTRLRRRHEARPYDTIDVDEHEVLIAGFGPFGQIVARILRVKRIPFTVLDKDRSEEQTSELQSLMRISYADSCLKKKNHK